MSFLSVPRCVPRLPVGQPRANALWVGYVGAPRSRHVGALRLVRGDRAVQAPLGIPIRTPPSSRKEDQLGEGWDIRAGELLSPAVVETKLRAAGAKPAG